MKHQERSLLDASPMRVAVWLVLALALPASALAQEINTAVVSLGDRVEGEFGLAQLALTTANPIGSAECNDTTMIRFRFTGVDQMRSTLYFYRGANCNDPMIRTSTTTTSCEELTPTIAIGAQTTVEADVPISGLVDCARGGSGVSTIWVLALNQNTDTVTAAGQQDSFALAYDLDPPTAPTDVATTGGEANGTVRWGGGQAGFSYEVFVDTAGCAGGTPSSTVLVAGMAPPDGTTPVATGTSTSAQVSLSSVATNEYVAVAVRSIDRGGNPSVLSQVVCMQKVDVVTWWETYCMQSPQPEECAGSGCAVRPARARGAWLLVPLLLASIVLVRRRAA